jgi:hypothetical protein
MRNLKIVLPLIGTLPIAFDLFEPRFAALLQTAALGLSLEMLMIARLYYEKGPWSAIGLMPR